MESSTPPAPDVDVLVVGPAPDRADNVEEGTCRPFTTPWRISGAAGVLFVALSLVASVTNVQPPTYDQDPATFAAWFAENGQRFRTGHFIAGVAFLLFYFPFYAGFCERLRQADGVPAIWSRVAWAGAIMSPAAGTASGSFSAALLGSRVSPEAAAFGAAGSFYAYVVSGALSGIVMVAAAIVILRTGVFCSRRMAVMGSRTYLSFLASTMLSLLFHRSEDRPTDDDDAGRQEGPIAPKSAACARIGGNGSRFGPKH
jgi:hypothetical protein